MKLNSLNSKERPSVEICDQVNIVKHEPLDNSLYSNAVEVYKNGLEGTSKHNIFSQPDSIIIKTEIKSEIVEIKLEPLDEDHTFINNQLLDTVSSEDYSYSSSSCDMCYKTYNDPYDLIVHKKVSHAEKPYICMFCNEKFVLCAHLNMHIFQHTGNMSSSYLVEPMTSIIKETKLTSNTTSKIAINIECLKLKNKKFQEAKPNLYVNNLVSENSHTESLNVHNTCRKYTNDHKPFTCTNCSFITVSRNEMLQHRSTNCSYNNKKTKRIHVPLKKNSVYNCNFCNKSFIKRQSLCGHLKCHSGKAILKKKNMTIPKKIKIEKTDGKKLKSINHFTLSNTSKAYKCQYCFRSFFTSRALNVHIHRMHTKKFFCKICNKKFFLTANLKKHMMKHHSTEQHNSNKTLEDLDACTTDRHNTSQNKIIKSISLTKQLNVKDDKRQKPYQCSYCAMRFCFINDLQDHFTTLHASKHVKNLRFKRNFFPCQWCSKKFSWTSGLYRHYKLKHESIKPFQCEQCTNCFSDYSSYRAHKKIHNLIE